MPAGEARPHGLPVMNGFAAWIMRGPMYASALATVALLLGAALPPFAWLSAAILALVILATGSGGLARVALPGVVVATVAAWLVTGSPWLVFALALVSWGPALVVAGTLRATVRLDLALFAAALMGWIVVLGIQLAAADMAALWQDVLARMMPPEALGRELDVEPAALEQVYARVAPLMTGLVAASLVLSGITATLLARWWQATLYNPGGFRAEFHGLRLGQTAALVTVGLMAAAAFTESALLFAVAVVPATVFLIQGLAVVHGVVAVRGLQVGWLVGLYVLGVVLFLQVAMILVVVGMADAWVDLRGRAAGRSE